MKTRPRDYVIDTAINAVCQLAAPQITAAEIQKRGEVQVYPGSFTVMLDGKPLAHVKLCGEQTFNLTIL